LFNKEKLPFQKEKEEKIMGQKINATIFRVGFNKNSWNSKYIANNREESSALVFNDFEIRKYLNNLFNFFGLIIHNLKINYTKKKILVSLSYFLTLKGVKMLKNIRGLSSPRKTFKRLPKFVDIILECLSKFTNYTMLIMITFQNLNKNVSLKLSNNFIRTIKRSRTVLREFNKLHFFNQTMNIIILVISLKNSSKILAEFLALQLKTLKNRKFFFYFLKRTLQIFLSSKSSRIQGIKIVISGRLTQLLRANTIKITVGNVPLQTVKAKIDYNQQVLYTQNGTFGLKVWVFENKSLYLGN